MVRAPYFDKFGMKKGAWSEEEDTKLRACIHRYGHCMWRQIPKLAGLSRCGKSYCRLRWMNYLRPGLRRGNFTQEEENIIVDLHGKLGGKWSTMATQLQGRSDNEIKNHWHTHLKNGVQKAQIAVPRNEQVDQPLESSKFYLERCSKKISNLQTQDEVGKLLAVLSSETSSSSSSTSKLSSCLSNGSDYAIFNDVTPQLSRGVWTESFLLDSESIISSSDNIFSPLGSTNDLTSQAFFQDHIMIDDVLPWSSMDLY